MKFEYFGDIANSAMLSDVLRKYDEEQMLQYEPFSRTQMCDELRDLCIRYKITVPNYIIEMLEDPNHFTEVALRKGYDPQKPLIDQFNDETGLNVKNPSELRKVLFRKSEGSEIDENDDEEEIDDEDLFVQSAFKNSK